jgi:hypothetical protein
MCNKQNYRLLSKCLAKVLIYDFPPDGDLIVEFGICNFFSQI